MVDQVQIQFIVNLQCSWTYRNDGRFLGPGPRPGREWDSVNSISGQWRRLIDGAEIAKHCSIKRKGEDSRGRGCDSRRSHKEILIS